MEGYMCHSRIWPLVMPPEKVRRDCRRISSSLIVLISGLVIPPIVRPWISKCEARLGKSPNAARSSPNWWLRSWRCSKIFSVTQWGMVCQVPESRWKMWTSTETKNSVYHSHEGMPTRHPPLSPAPFVSLPEGIQCTHKSDEWKCCCSVNTSVSMCWSP